MNLEHGRSGFTDAAHDFRRASWGMSKKEVMRSEGVPPLSHGEGYVTYGESVMGLDAVVGFHFRRDSLVEAGYAFREPLGGESMYVREYAKVKGILSGSYGNPAIDEDICAGCGLCGKVCRCGDAVRSAQSLIYLTEWMTGRSVIRLVLMGEKGVFDFGLLHRSSAHALCLEGECGERPRASCG